MMFAFPAAFLHVLNLTYLMKHSTCVLLKSLVSCYFSHVLDRVLWSISIVFQPVFRHHLVPVLLAAMVYASLILSAMSRTKQFIN